MESAQAEDKVHGVNADDLAAGKSSARVFRAMRSAGSLKVGTSTRPLAM